MNSQNRLHSIKIAHIKMRIGNFSFLDAKVLRFLRIIQPILIDIHLIVWPRLLHSLEAIIVLLCDRIRTRVARLTLFGQFRKICELYPTLVYRVPMLDINGSFMEEDIGALAQWLARPRSTRLANVLVLSFDIWTQLVEQLKQVLNNRIMQKSK